MIVYAAKVDYVESAFVFNIPESETKSAIIVVSSSEQKCKDVIKEIVPYGWVWKEDEQVRIELGLVEINNSVSGYPLWDIIPDDALYKSSMMKNTVILISKIEIIPFKIDTEWIPDDFSSLP